MKEQEMYELWGEGGRQGRYPITGYLGFCGL